MRLLLPISGVLLLVALNVGCGDDFAQAQKVGTIEAMEEYLSNNPQGRFRIQATAQLETMYLEKARKERTLEAYDAYVDRWPKGDLRERALEEREQFLFDWASQEGTSAAWDKFLEEYPRATKKRAKEATRRAAVAGYREHLSWTEVKIEPVNLAEDPTGPKDGWGFSIEVTNNGKRTLRDLRFTVDYLDDEDRALESKEWPLVAKQWPIPMEEEKKVPMKPGETRTWWYTAGGLPEEHWAKKARVYPTRIAFVE